MNLGNIAFLANILFTGAVATCLATVTHWFLLRRAGIPVTKVQFFLGPGAVKFQWHETTVEFGSIPCGSNVVSDVVALRSLHRALHVMILLGGPATLFLLAMLFLGPQMALHHFVHGFGELLQGILHPKTTGPHLVGQLQEVYQRSFLEAAAILFAKLAALNLIPLAGPTFFQIVRLFFKSEESPLLNYVSQIYIASTFVLFGFWGYVVMYYTLTAK